MDYPKSVPGVGLVGGKFVDENTATGRQGSLIPSAWGNAVTEELLNILRAAGLQPNEAVENQIAQVLFVDPTEVKRGMPLVATQAEVKARSSVPKVIPPNLAPRLLRITKITASGTYNKPNDVGSILVYCTGGGGGGGGIGSALNAAAVGGGGGGGSTSMKFIENPNSSYAVAIGAGGAGGVGAASGSSGGSTSFGGVCIGAGGAGGGIGFVRSSLSTAGPGGGQVSGSVGDVVIPGTPGMLGFAGPNYAMVAPSGQSLFSQATTYGEDTGTSIFPGSVSEGYGGGGGGAHGVNNGISQNGGAGSSGVIYVWEYA